VLLPLLLVDIICSWPPSPPPPPPPPTTTQETIDSELPEDLVRQFIGTYVGGGLGWLSVEELFEKEYLKVRRKEEGGVVVSMVVVVMWVIITVNN